MNTLVHYKTDSEKKAFMCGLSFYLGYLKAHNLAYDVFLHNPRFATTKNGVHFAYDPETHMTSGLGHEIDNTNEEKAKKKKTKNIVRNIKAYSSLTKIENGKISSEAEKTLQSINKVSDELSKKEQRAELRPMLTLYAKNMEGYVDREISENENVRFYISKEFKKECTRQFVESALSSLELDSYKELSKLMIYTMNNIPDILTTGVWDQNWVENFKDHNHPNEEFSYITKKLTYNGKKYEITLSLARKTNNSEERAKVLYAQNIKLMNDNVLEDKAELIGFEIKKID